MNTIAIEQLPYRLRTYRSKERVVGIKKKKIIIIMTEYSITTSAEEGAIPTVHTTLTPVILTRVKLQCQTP
jgi:hypothetical protein